MANDFPTEYRIGQTLYVRVLDAAGRIWNTASLAFETENLAHWTDYDIPLTEVSPGHYNGNFPTAITTSGTYDWDAWLQLGGSPASSDASLGERDLIWNGSAAALGSGSLLPPRPTNCRAWLS